MFRSQFTAAAEREQEIAELAAEEAAEHGWDEDLDAAEREADLAWA